MEKEVRVPDYFALSPWEDSSSDDHAIAEYLRRKILKESRSTLAFYGVALLTSVLFLIFEAMVQINLFWSIIFTVVSIGFMALIYDLVHTNKLKKKQIDSRKFKTCNIIAFDINDKYNEKYCRVQDKEGHVFEDAVSYHSYFSMNERDGVMVVLPRLIKSQKDYVIVFPKSYLKMENEARKK